MFRSLFLSIVIFANACAIADETPRTVSVAGTGTASAAADGATVRMAIVARAEKLDAAQSAAAKVTADVLGLTDRLDIDRNKVDTTGATVRPDYRWNRETEEQELRGYIAERQMNVRVDDLGILGQLIEGAVAAGVNQVSPPELHSSNKEETYREALRLAALDARANAEVLAETLGAELGDALSIAAGSRTPPPPGPQMRLASVAMEADAAATYNPADLTFSKTVNVVFEITR